MESALISAGREEVARNALSCITQPCRSFPQRATCVGHESKTCDRDCGRNRGRPGNLNKRRLKLRIQTELIAPA